MADENQVRMAMHRADATKTETPNTVAEIRRVHVKHEIASHVDNVFQSRTTDDGTILHTSKELLIEDLTNIVEGLLRRALSGRKPPSTATYSIPPGAQQTTQE